MYRIQDMLILVFASLVFFIVIAVALGAFLVMKEGDAKVPTEDDDTTTRKPESEDPSWHPQDGAQWSACSATACGSQGTRTRRVVCKDADGEIVDDQECLQGGSSRDAVATEVCAVPSCDWVESVSVPCMNGQETVTYTCKFLNGEDAPGKCTPQTRDPVTRSCQVYRWSIGPTLEGCRTMAGTILPCSTTGDTYGVTLRQVTCLNASGVPVQDALCNSSEKPLVGIGACTVPRCPQAVTYSWQPSGTWSDCSAKCEGGTQTEDTVCRGTDNSTDPTKCNLSQRPVNSRVCNTMPCQYEYRTGNWSQCSASCGGGYRERTVTCYDKTNDRTVDDSKCSHLGQRPSGVERGCNSQACPPTETFHWVYPAFWSACQWVPNTTECKRSRDPWCVRRTAEGQESMTLESNCNANQKLPREFQTCDSSSCPRGTYRSAVTGPCTAPNCGQGTQPQTSTCVDSSGNTMLESACSGLQRPPSTAPCSAPCYDWRPTPNEEWVLPCRPVAVGNWGINFMGKFRKYECYDKNTGASAEPGKCSGIPEVPMDPEFRQWQVCTSIDG
jgi:hypothetical protein